MKMNVARYCNIVLAVCMIVSACSEKTVSVDSVIPLSVGRIDDAQKINFPDEFSDFAIIKLENNEKAMLSWVQKVCVTPKGFYFLDYKAPEQILHFDLEGKFLCRIGEYGRKSSEYTMIYNFCTNEAGDTIAILESERILFYNDKGQYLKTQHFDEHMDDILLMSKGLLATDYHHVGSHLFMLYNNSLKSRFVPLSSGLIRGAASSQNFLQQNAKYICYYDFFTSRFYLMDKQNLSKVKCYLLDSDKMLSEEKAFAMNGDRSKYAFVSNYIIDDNFIIGNVSIDRHEYDFCIDINNDKFTLVEHNFSNYHFHSYYDGYYYKVVSSGFLIDILQQPYSHRSREMLREALRTYKDSISDKDNYYILKMKKR